jgi:hypothetical protein
MSVKRENEGEELVRRESKAESRLGGESTEVVKGEISMWVVESCSTLSALLRKSARVKRFRFSNQAEMSPFPPFKVWDLGTLTLKARLTGHDGAVLSLQLVRERDWLISSSGTFLRNLLQVLFERTGS